jgi:hydrogenase expression/formation protein HypC
MCLAVPALVKTIDGAQALVELGGVERRVSLALTPDVRVGDYVLIHTGFAIGVVDEEEAQVTLNLLRELAETHEVDELFYETGLTETRPTAPGDYHLAPGLAVDLSRLADLE